MLSLNLNEKLIQFSFYSILDEYPDDDDAHVAHPPPEIHILRREASVESE